MKSSISAKVFSVLTMLALGCAVTARAEMIELTNGDHYRGVVLSMNATSIEFQSEILGRVTVPRNKVANISLHEVTAKPTAKATVPPNGAPIISAETNSSAIASTTSVAQGSQADAVIQQLRQQGVDPKLIDQVQEQIFGKASPEAAQKFNEMMGGLMTGRLSVNDIRKQAQNSINQINIAKKELGGDAGEMLDSYLTILQKFVQESGNDSVPPVPAKPTPQN